MSFYERTDKEVTADTRRSLGPEDTEHRPAGAERKKDKEFPMSTALYSLSFIPLLLVTLTVHELGHLIAARLMGIRVSAFQIGIGWTLATLRTGRTEVSLTPDTEIHSPGGKIPQPGQLVSIFVTHNSAGGWTAAAVLPIRGKRYETAVDPERMGLYNERHMRITGRVRKSREGNLTIGDMAWSLKAIPLMAAVHLPEDPAGTTPGVYNTAPWARQMIVTLAGPAANLALLAAAIGALALSPSTTVHTPILTIQTVAHGSPAELAGLERGDHIIQVGTTLVPNREDLKGKIFKAMLSGRPMELQVKRGERTLTARVYPDQVTGKIGVTLAHYVQPRQRRSMAPGDVGRRFTKLGMVYFNAAKLMVAQAGEEESPPALSGPIAAAYYTAQAIEYARLKAWIAILAAFTLGTAVLNLLPIPPLDGYRLVIQTVQAARKGKPVSPRLESAMVFGGMTLIIMTGLYMVFHDIMHLLE